MTKLEAYQGDVRAVTVYTHTFVMGGKNGLADDRENPFYTASAASPEQAKAQAHAVYLRAIACTHRMARKGPMLLECEVCGVQQRTPLTRAASADEKDQPAPRTKRKPERGGLLGWLRTA